MIFKNACVQANKEATVLRNFPKFAVHSCGSQRISGEAPEKQSVHINMKNKTAKKSDSLSRSLLQLFPHGPSLRSVKATLGDLNENPEA